MVGVATMVGHTYGAIRARAAHVNLRAAVYRAFCNDRQASISPSLALDGMYAARDRAQRNEGRFRARGGGKDGTRGEAHQLIKNSWWGP